LAVDYFLVLCILRYRIGESFHMFLGTFCFVFIVSSVVFCFKMNIECGDGRNMEGVENCEMFITLIVDRTR